MYKPYVPKLNVLNLIVFRYVELLLKFLANTMST